MNRTVLFSTLMGLGGMLMTACTSSSVVEDPTVPEKEVPVSFGSSVTRAVVDGQKQNLQDFGVWGGFGGMNNLFDGETVRPDGTYTGLRYWVNNEDHHFYALHPHPASWGLPTATVACANDGTFTIRSFDAAAKRGTVVIDLMTAPATGLHYTTGQTPQPVALKFQHELAWVEFQIKAEQAVTIDFVQLSGIAYKGDVTLTPVPGTGSYQAVWTNLTTSAAAGEPFVENQVNIPQEKVNQTVYLLGGNLLLPPQSLTDQQVFSMQWTYTDMVGENRTVHVKMPQAGLDRWEKGKHYVYSAVIPPTPVNIKFNVSVQDWKETTVSADL